MKKRVVCFGDSNTWGHNPDSGERHDENTRWTGRLQKLLGDDWVVVEEGQRGRATVWDDPVERRMAGLKYLWPCMDSHAPIDLLIIMLGTNDTKQYFGVQARSIADGAGLLVDMAQKCNFGTDGKAPKVLLISPIHLLPHTVYPYLFGEEAAAKTLQFSGEFRAVAERLGCEFLDAAEYAQPDPEEGVHMNAESHRTLAEAVFRKIRQIYAE